MAGDAPADDTTIRPSKRPAPAGEARAPWLTVLWHPARERIGQVAPLPARLSRLEPELGDPGATTRAPLGEAHVSRTAAKLNGIAGEIPASLICFRGAVSERVHTG